ncbi:hypothetical protein D3876_03140 [Sphingomonas cavernae]|uniref:Secreted protein n=2 Tax=Sphingomonas cavernae TaxID=2320861 RepID=A0A418WQ35_9SPHN|nr:hypothetical protein D3876_03140 [Sphingomonas cavernae]
MSPFARVTALGAVIAFVLAVPAAAEDTAASKPKKGDPDEVVCEKQEVLGSRLAVKKVCKTRAQWEEQRRADRDLVHKSQMGSCARQAGC